MRAHQRSLSGQRPSAPQQQGRRECEPRKQAQSSTARWLMAAPASWLLACADGPRAVRPAVLYKLCVGAKSEPEGVCAQGDEGVGLAASHYLPPCTVRVFGGEYGCVLAACRLCACLCVCVRQGLPSPASACLV